MIKEYTYRETYITFLLIGDDFDISKLLREKCRDLGMDIVFDICVHIATKFIEYDNKNNIDFMGIYDSFCNFLYDYNKELKDLINNDVDFEVVYDN